MWGWLVWGQAVGRWFCDDAGAVLIGRGASKFGNSSEESMRILIGYLCRPIRSCDGLGGLGLVRSGVDLAVTRWQPYRLTPPCALPLLRPKNGRHRLFRCRPHSRGATWCSALFQRTWGQPRARRPRRRGGCRGCDPPRGWAARRKGPCDGVPSARPQR